MRTVLELLRTPSHCMYCTTRCWWIFLCFFIYDRETQFQAPRYLIRGNEALCVKWGPFQQFGPHEDQVLNWGPFCTHWLGREKGREEAKERIGAKKREETGVRSNQEMLEPKKSGKEKAGKKPRKVLEPKKREDKGIYTLALRIDGSGFTHFCCNSGNLTIYALLSRCRKCRDLRALGAGKNCESWDPSQKNRNSSPGGRAKKNVHFGE